MEVAGGGLEVGVAEEFLDGADVRPGPDLTDTSMVWMIPESR